jgi:flagellar basal-body rod protein FlgB
MQMLWLDNVSSALLSKDLDGLWTRQQATLDNMANLSTPGYKSKSVSFEDQLRASVSDSGQTAEDTVQNIQNVEPVTTTASDESYRADENGVDLEKESVEIARTQLNYNYSLQEMTDYFSRLKTAIKTSD